MDIVSDISSYKAAEPAALTVGTFDGVHLGHQKIINVLLRTGKKRNLKTTVVTFDPHPKEIVKMPESYSPIKILTTLDEKIDALSKFDIDTLMVIPFTEEFSRTDPKIFVRDTLCQRFKAEAIIMGYDHNFGRDRSGNSETLQSLGGECGFTTEIVGPVNIDGSPVSSTRIRNLLTIEGDVVTIKELLSRNYELSGKVVRGEGIGKQIDFPTANIEIDNKVKALPRNGVYCVEVHHKEDSYRGMANIGVRPTFNGTDLTVEVHILLDELKDIYGDLLRISFLSRIRDEKKFDSPEDLIEQLNKDKIACSA